ncbi:hypothetical protein HPB52_003689 [Rhipicephalus sanguineus]|uniref:RNA-dependent RNA polymerase n=1 Tax=Rhipicephalus sanguineus TaxID=34632 RepID=A0A9D4SN70_RHISA|nr:hypothetical protein HPB52_003689 [Rhipicephalus sanguineus]
MLMGEVVNDIPARPGSPAQLRWERHLTIGCNCIGGPVRTASLCGGLFLKLVLRDHSLARRVIGRLSQRCSNGTLFCYAPIQTYCPDSVVGRWTTEVVVRCEEMQRTLPFPCAYALKAALHITFDVLDQMVLMSTTTFNKLMQEIERRSKKEPSVVERTLSHIVTSIDAGNVVMFAPAFYALCSQFKDEKPPQVARGTCLVRSVFVTPGRLILRPAQVHFENRILRQFNSEFAIRASFRDDNLDKLSFTLNLHSSRDALLDAVVARFLRDGLRVGAREFKFLALSTSQLRDHGTWMYAADEQHNSAATIREWMGQFEGIPNVAKRMARMGQCFSSTEQSVRVKACDVQVVPDIVGGAHPVSKKPYIFSDGVGMMSVPLAEEVYEVMKMKDRPSAMQIRYAGAKGMLCVNPALPDKKLLCLRPSMQKFPCSTSEYLEVVKASAPRSVTLNRPLITILEQLGVPIDTFVYLQECMILEFTDALVNESSAVEVLAAWCKFKLPYEDLSKAGFQLTLDPFFRSLLLAVYRNAVAGLRYKTRIALPVDRARNMLGVVDTTGKLQYGEALCYFHNIVYMKKVVQTQHIFVKRRPQLRHPLTGRRPRRPEVLRPELFAPLRYFPTPAIVAEIAELCTADFTMRELRSVLDSRKRRSAPGSDGITYQMLRNIDSSLLPQLLAAYNTVWRTGELPASVQSYINAVDYFVSGIGLELSAEKTEALLVHPNPLARYQVARLSLRGCQLPWQRRVRYLGLTIDHRLSWKPAIAEIRKGSRNIARVASCVLAGGKGCSPVLALRLYNAIATARTLYSVQLVGLNPIQWESLDVVHRGAVRRIFALPRTSPVGPTLAETNQLPLSLRAKAGALRHVHRMHQTQQGQQLAIRLLSRPNSGMGRHALEYAALVPEMPHCGWLPIPPHRDRGLEISTTVPGVRCKRRTPQCALQQETAAVIDGQLSATRLASSSRVMCALCIRMRESHREHLRAYFRGLASTDVRERFFSGCASDAAAPPIASSGFLAAETQSVCSAQRTRPSTTSCCSARDTMIIAVVCSEPSADWAYHTCAWTNSCSPAHNILKSCRRSTRCWIFSATPTYLRAFEARFKPSRDAGRPSRDVDILLALADLHDCSSLRRPASRFLLPAARGITPVQGR